MVIKFIEQPEREKGIYYVQNDGKAEYHLVKYEGGSLRGEDVFRDKGNYPIIYDESFQYVGYLSDTDEVTLGTYQGRTISFETEGRGFDAKNEFGEKVKTCNRC